MISEKTTMADMISTDSNIVADTRNIDDNNNNKVETNKDIEAQTTVGGDDNATPRDGQPLVQLGKLELALVMLGYTLT
jgi:hypothetical protein